VLALSIALHVLQIVAAPVAGLDVSHHQGRIDWPRVANEGKVQFVFIKATQGKSRVDPAFRRNWREARRAGLRVGAYHYFSFCSPAEDQARNFLAVLPRSRDALPPAVDVEHLLNCAPDPDPGKVRADLRRFLEIVERATGKKPVLYATADVLSEYVLGHLDVPLWVRSTPEDPEPVLQLKWRVWQYDDQSAVPGIEGPVDHDYLEAETALGVGPRERP
jgi:lysozyme